jgi:predicted small secreted protein
MFDTKRIIQLGIGVAVGMLAYHFISKAMNKEPKSLVKSNCGCQN